MSDKNKWVQKLLKQFKEEKNKKVDLNELHRLQAKTGQILTVVFGWRAKTYVSQMFFPQTRMPTKKDVLDAVRKVYPGAILYNRTVSHLNPNMPLIQMPEEKQSKGQTNDHLNQSYQRGGR